jgi:hypothetical protein
MEALSLLTIFPVGALLIGVAFAIATFYRRKLIPGMAAVLWLAYGVYESLMYARILCTGECNIRVDLLLIYPLLLLITVAGIISTSRKSKAVRRIR